MAYRWRYSTSGGAQAPGPDRSFDDQSEAEDWLGANWSVLLECGVDEVTLLDGDDPVYGPMSLHSPD